MAVSARYVVEKAAGAAYNPMQTAGDVGRDLGKFIGEEIYYKTHGVSETVETALEASQYEFTGPELNGFIDKMLDATELDEDGRRIEATDTELAIGLAAGAVLAEADGGEILKSTVAEYAQRELEGQAIEALTAAGASAAVAYGAVEGVKSGVSTYRDVDARHEPTIIALAGQVHVWPTKQEDGTYTGNDYLQLGHTRPSQDDPEQQEFVPYEGVPGISAGAVLIGDLQYTIITDATPFAEGKEYQHLYVLGPDGEFMNPDDFNDMIKELINGDDPLLASHANTALVAQSNLAVLSLYELKPYASEMRYNQHGLSVPAKIDTEKYETEVGAEIRASASDIGKTAGGIAGNIEDAKEELATREQAEPTQTANVEAPTSDNDTTLSVPSGPN